ncbi:hypothetical protein [Spirillospora sp. NPDC029432]|uniref:hypothetical protein n=1 Tax=Spirillospora sp. NPDC029432 TaxID=3154599 RepID=UPI0034551FB7
MHLDDALAWTIDEPQLFRDFLVHADGRPLADVTRLPDPEADDGLMPYPDPHARYGTDRFRVSAATPDGRPRFIVDWTSDPMKPRPAFVTAPDGAPIGELAVSVGGFGGAFKFLTGRGGAGYVLRDARGEVLAGLHTPPMNDPDAEGGVEIAGENAGEEIGRFSVGLSPYGDRRRRYTMRLHRPVPEPLRTLLLASLIGMELMVPVIALPGER